MFDHKKANTTTAVTGLEVAIIGMAGRFPGARNVLQFWDNLKQGHESLYFMSDEELATENIDHEWLQDPAYVKAKGGVIEDKEYFDALFFDYSPREAELMDPQVRIFHECAWTALEDAGYDQDSYNGAIGLYAGSASSLYWEAYLLFLGKSSQYGHFAASQLANKDYLTTRVSYKLNLKGPSVSVQTACSTSLVATHLACRALLTGECRIALAGGVTLSHLPGRGYLYQEGMVFSRDSHCRAFDARASGTVGGGGVGIVVLKLLKAALIDGDHLYAVIKGSAINNDGKRKLGFTAPSVKGQMEVIHAAQAFARVPPESIGYIEAHGTATVLGDPIEMEALKTAFNTGKKCFCAIGSVKTNIGHLDAAAGVAGLIKTVLALNHRVIPPSLHYNTSNPKIDFENSPFYVNTETREWQRGNSPLRAGVSSFAIGGTNAHVVLEEAPQRLPNPGGRKWKILMLSAKTRPALDKVCENLLAYLEENPEIIIDDAAYTLQVGRRHFNHRRILCCTDVADACARLSAAGPGGTNLPSAIAPESKCNIVFMFPGQGAQYVNMGLELYEKETVFREELNRCFEILDRQSGITVKDILYPSMESSGQSNVIPNDINQTQLAQSLLFAFQYALARLLITWGIEPSAMIGHSIGEYVAACLAGVFSLENALKIVSIRGRLMQEVEEGAMLSVPMTEEELQSLLPPQLSLASVNSPSRCVVSGPNQAIKLFAQQLARQGCECRRLHTSHAFHSDMMNPILKPFEAEISRVTLNKPGIRYISNLTGGWTADHEAINPGYWGKHLRQTVRFSEGVEELLKISNALFIEVGPGQALSTFVKQHDSLKKTPVVVNLVRQIKETESDLYYLLNRLGVLWLNGAPIDWPAFYRWEKRQKVSLPTYPFMGQPYPASIQLPDKIDFGSGDPAFKGTVPPPGEEPAGDVLKTTLKYTRPSLSTIYAAPVNSTQERLVNLWQKLFGFQEIGIRDDYFELGGDSLMAATLITQIYKEFKISVPLTELLSRTTIEEFSGYINAYLQQAPGETSRSIEATEEKEYYALSSAQKRLFMLQQLEKNAVGYNELSALTLEGVIDGERLQETFRKLIRRHESFRTSFKVAADEPVQMVHEDVSFAIEYYDPQPVADILDRFVRPFDLDRAPLLRVVLVKLSGLEHLLLMDIHHIIFDGSSQRVLIEDFMVLYKAGENETPLPTLRIQYKDFSQWENSGKESLKKQEAYWLRAFTGEIPVLELPIDYSRPLAVDFSGSVREFRIGSAETRALQELARREAATLFMILLAIYNVLLSRVTLQEDIVVGTPTAGRWHTDLEQVIGMFVNTLALRNYPRENHSFSTFLQAVKRTALGAFENQDFPFEDLVERVVINRDAARNPLFDTMFALQNIKSAKIHIPGLMLKPYDIETLKRISKFDLSLYAVEEGDGLYFFFEYSTKLFRAETIDPIVTAFTKIAAAVGTDPAVTLGGIEIISEDEKERLLQDFNDKEAEYPRDKTIHQLFAKQVEQRPNQVALLGPKSQIPDPKFHTNKPCGGNISITYRELDNKSDQLVYLLKEKGVTVDTIVGIMVERSIEMIIGIMGILKAGGVYLPIDPGYPLARINYMLSDSRAKIFLTTKNSAKTINFDIEMIYLDSSWPRASLNLSEGCHPDFPTSQLPSFSHLPIFSSSLPSSLAYVIYTSGSTGNPKGVMVEHGNVNYLVYGLRERIYKNYGENLGICLVSPFVFDASVKQIFGALLLGNCLCIVPEEARINVEMLFEFYKKHQVDISDGTPAHLQLIMENQGRECPGVRNYLIGGEPLSRETVDGFLNRFVEDDPGISNLYGPTECTVDAASFQVNRDNIGLLHTIPIGNPLPNCRIYVLAGRNKLQPIGVPGELCIMGKGVSRGYLNQPELTNEKFKILNDKLKIKNGSGALRGELNVFVDGEAHEINELLRIRATSNKKFLRGGPGGAVFTKRVPPGCLRQKIYRTGDLARWLPKGDIEFVGRLDQQVKIRGYRIELGEIEHQLLTHGKIREAIVIARDNNNDKYLCAYIVAQSNETNPIEPSEIREYLSNCLPDYMVPSYFVQLARIPLTPNGKVDRRALPAPGIDRQYNYVAPRDDIEKKLVALWSDLLGVEKEKLCIDENFFHLGGNSLKATVLASRIHKEFNINVSFSGIFKSPHIRGLAAVIKKAAASKHIPVEPVESKEYYPLSSAQRRLYILQQMDNNEGTSCNIPSVWQLEGKLEVEKFARVYQQLIRRHESLRTFFTVVNDEPVQRVTGVTVIGYGALVMGEAGKNKIKDIIKNFIKPFDLTRTPLFRVELIKLPHTLAAPQSYPSQEGIEHKYILMVDMHHIISDGMSVGILVREFMELYAGKGLPVLRLQYKDYSQWQKKQVLEKALKQQESYWLKEFSGEIPVLDLPRDYPRPAVQEFEGSSISFEIDQEETEALKSLADEQGVTLFMLLLSLYTLCLSRLSGQEDIVVGTPIAGRRHADIESIMGMFVNTLALRNFLDGQKSFIQFLEELKENTVKAFENQDYLYENLVEKVEVERDTGRNPLFDTMLVMQNFDALKIEIPGLKVQPLDYETRISKFDLTLTAVEAGESLLFIFEYRTKLFKEETIQRFIGFFTKTISTVIEKPGIIISGIEIIGAEEKIRILHEFNETVADYPKDKTIQRLFEEQVERMPDNIALHGYMIAWMKVGPKLQIPKYKLQTNSKFRTTNNKESGALRAEFDAFGEIQLSYGLLNEESNRMAYTLIEKGVGPDTIVGIMIERSVEMIIGILGILKSGCAYLPIDPEYPQERIDFMLKDSGAKMLATTGNLSKEGKKVRRWEDLGNLEIVFLNIFLSPDLINSPAFLASKIPNFHLSPAVGKRIASTSLVYIIYTSGTTGKPKGVAIEHHSLVNRLNWMQKKYPIDQNDIILHKTTFNFDVSVWEIFWWSIVGAKVCLLIPGGEKDPEIITQTVKRNNITTMHFVPSMLSVFLDYLKGSGIVKKLSSLKQVITSGEALLSTHVERFNGLLNKENGTILANLYGPTEATIDVSYFDCSKGGEKEIIPIGKPIDNIRLYILDKHLHIQPIGISGELCIAGIGLARGYLNRHELTSEKFCLAPWALFEKTIFGPHKNFSLNFFEGHLLLRAKSQEPRAKLYKTGDLARWLEDGNIEFLGRIDHQVKIRGFRVELGEIESRLLKYPGIKEAVVLAQEEEKGDKYLCAYMVSDEEINISYLREQLSTHLPDYMIPSYFMQTERIPLTPNGKIDRKALPVPTLKVEEEYTAPRGPVDEKMIGIWSEVLGVRREVIGIDSNFFKLGGHSLRAIVMVTKIHKAFNVELPLVEVFNRPTIRKLVGYIKEALAEEEETYASIEMAEKKEYYLLSSAQKRLFLLQQMDEESTVYNIPLVIQLNKMIDKAIVEETFRQLIQRHESFRISFAMIEGEPVQRVHDEVEFKIKLYNLGHRTQGMERTSFALVSGLYANTIKAFIHPFDLSRAPLLRVGLIEREEKKYLLMVDMHHVISDGTSIKILMEEFTILYEGGELPELRVQYKDYALWQASEKVKEKVKNQEVFWLNEFSGEIPVLELPWDYSRPVVQSFEGSCVRFEIEAEELAYLKQLAFQERATLYMTLLAIFNILLSKLSGQEDIIIGSAVVGRRHFDLQHIIGMLVNTLALRNFPDGEKSFKRFLSELKSRMLEAFENQDYQFEDLVEKVAVNRDASRNPLFDVMLALQNMGNDNTEFEAPGISDRVGDGVSEEIAGQIYESQVSRFDLTFNGIEFRGRLLFAVEYCLRLFKRESIERFISYFKRIMECVLKDPGISLGNIDILSEDERIEILDDFNDTKTVSAIDKTIIEQFQHQVGKIPHHIALICREQQLTYSALNQKINQLGNQLRKKGVGPNFIVGLMLERSVQMIEALLAILKAGGAYLPIDPNYPQNRVHYMLEDSESRLLLTRSHLSVSFGFCAEVIDVENAVCQDKCRNFQAINHPDDLIYMIYTSGSTGKPKGTMVKTRGFLNLLHWYTVEFKMGAVDNNLLIAPISFDLTQKNLFSPFISGGRLILASPGIPDYLEESERIEKNHITIINCAPGVFYPFIEFNSDSDFVKLRSLRQVFLGGTSIKANKLLPWVNSKSFHGEIVNTYGPTECTDVVSFYSIPRATLDQQQMIPIGKPLPNVKLFILSINQKLLPIALAGELCIGGIGLSVGYCNNVELTVEKFIEVPGLLVKRIYRTGDLARWLPDGNIEFLGRIDQQVKIRGLRIELGEIESQLLRHRDIKEAVAAAKTHDSGDKYLCAYLISVSGIQVDVEELREFLSLKLPNYMIPSYFMQLGGIPMTPNGKINYWALPTPEEKSYVKYIAPRNNIEKKLVNIWSEVMKLDKDIISIDSDFFDLGGHSLQATVLTAKIHKEVDVKVPLAEIFKTPTIRGLSAYIQGAAGDKYTAIKTAEEKEYYDISSAQKRMYFMQQIDLASTAYNIGNFAILDRGLDAEILKKTIQKLIARHESLRTSFEMIANEPIQKIHKSHGVKFEIEVHETGGATVEEFARRLVKPFELSKVPLFNVNLIKYEKTRYLLFFDIHHIVTDGISQGILLNDINGLYDGKELPPLRIQYKDYTEWQKMMIDSGVLKQQEEYWLRQLSGEIPVLQLLTDYPRPENQGFEGDQVDLNLNPGITEKIMKTVKETGVTLNIFLLALYNVLLANYSGQEDIVIGIPIAGRLHSDLQQIIGMFINMLPIRNQPNKNKTFKEFLAEVKQNSLNAYENQDYQFDDLVLKLGLQRNRNRNPIFDTVFVVQNFAMTNQNYDDNIEEKDIHINPGISQFDLIFEALETNNSIKMVMLYSTTLFKKSSVEKMVKQYIEILEQVVENLELKLEEILITHDFLMAESNGPIEDQTDFRF